MAASIVNEATSPQATPDREPTPEKNPAAVALGKLGGKKGGPARAKKLSAERLSEIGKKAASKRWAKSKKKHS